MDDLYDQRLSEEEVARRFEQPLSLGASFDEHSIRFHFTEGTLVLWDAMDGRPRFWTWGLHASVNLDAA